MRDQWDWGIGCKVEEGGAHFREAWQRHIENSIFSKNLLNVPLAGHSELLFGFQGLGWIASWQNPLAPDRGAEWKIPSVLTPVTISYIKWNNSDEILAFQPLDSDSPVRTSKNQDYVFCAAWTKTVASQWVFSFVTWDQAVLSPHIFNQNF